MVPPMQKPMMPTGPSFLSSLIAASVSLHHRVPIGLGDEVARVLDLVRRVAAFEILLRAVEQRRRHRGIAFAREPVADRADVMIDAENFLNDDDAALRRAGRIGAIGAELETCRMTVSENCLPKRTSREYCKPGAIPWPGVGRRQCHAFAATKQLPQGRGTCPRRANANTSSGEDIGGQSRNSRRYSVHFFPASRPNASASNS